MQREKGRLPLGEAVAALWAVTDEGRYRRIYGTAKQFTPGQEKSPLRGLSRLPKNDVIARRCASPWKSPVRRKSTKLRPNCLKIRGIPTPACALVRNDNNFFCSPFYCIFSSFSRTFVKYSGRGAKTMTGRPSLGWRKTNCPAWRHWLSWPSSGFLWP